MFLLGVSFVFTILGLGYSGFGVSRGAASGSRAPQPRLARRDLPCVFGVGDHTLVGPLWERGTTRAEDAQGTPTHFFFWFRPEEVKHSLVNPSKLVTSNWRPGQIQSWSVNLCMGALGEGEGGREEAVLTFRLSCHGCRVAT